MPLRRTKSVLLLGVDLSTGGGVNRVISDLAEILRDLGCRVTVSSARGSGEPTYPLPPDVELVIARAGGVLRYLHFLARLRRRRFDYAVGFWAEDNILLSAMFLFSRSKLVLTEHQSWFYPPPIVRLLRRFAYRLATRVFVLNRAEMHYYSKFLDNVELIPNPVPPRQPRPSHGRQNIILAVGHLIGRKNFSDLLRAVDRSGLDAEGWQTVIVGEGPEKERLTRLVEQLRLQNVSIVRPTPQIDGWYGSARILAITSKVEVFSLVLAEGIQAGTVPVAYAADGPAFILEEFPDHLVPIGDVDGLASRLRRFAHAPDLAAQGAAIRASVSGKFAPKSVAKAWERLLRGA